MPRNADVLTWARQFLRQWRYIYGGSRVNPAATGGTDCSGFTHAGYLQVKGISIGYTTGSQFTSPTTELIYHGNGNWDNVPWGIMKPGDLILMSYDTTNFSSGGGSHVGFYTGNTGQVIDCGSTPCPTERDIRWYNAISIAVKRVPEPESEDDTMTDQQMTQLVSMMLNAPIDDGITQDTLARRIANIDQQTRDILKVAREDRFIDTDTLKVVREAREVGFSVAQATGLDVKAVRAAAATEAARLDKARKDQVGANFEPVLSPESLNRG